MAKKPPRGKLLKLPSKRGKVIPLPIKPKKKATAARKGAATAKPKTARGRVAPPQPMPPPVGSVDERLAQAMEELAAARDELSRLGHALTAAHRELEERKLSSGSTQSNLRAELEATRTDLKTALAELEIARADKERVALAAGKRMRELEAELSRLRQSAAGAGKPQTVPPTQGRLFPDEDV